MQQTRIPRVSRPVGGANRCVAPLRPRVPAARCRSTVAHGFVPGAEMAKAALLDAINTTRRGSAASRDQRGVIEELQIGLEAFQGVRELDYNQLDGLWELVYTTADDLVPVIDVENLLKPPVGFLPPPLQVGSIYQRFTAPVDGVGKVQNIIEFSVPLFTKERDGIRLWVDASYEVRSGHRIRLQFDQANVSNVRLSGLAKTLLAPSGLPRNPLQDAVIKAIQEFRWQLPFRSAERVAAGVENKSGEAGSGGGAYVITYLDDDFLVCRASEMKGIYLLRRVPESQLAGGEEETAITTYAAA